LTPNVVLFRLFADFFNDDGIDSPTHFIQIHLSYQTFRSITFVCSMLRGPFQVYSILA
jgi:hypothetical protein